MRVFILFLILIPNFSSTAQDTVYTRKVIKKLTSKECFGRGYVNNGLDIAARYITAELKSSKAKPLFSTGYFQLFNFNVNTFPNKMEVKINGKLLKPGADYIVSPESGSVKGKLQMQRKDSVTFFSKESPLPFIINVKKKLTYSVATESVTFCGIDLLEKTAPKEISTAEINIGSEVLSKFPNNNICAYIDGTKNNDSMIVFSAHYDHLGGMGKKTYFPGANDNASGVSVLLNLVKYYQTHPPKYKTVFIFFAGEEAGLIGSKYFVDNNTVDLKKIKFLVNLDLLGTGDEGIMLVNGAIHTKEYDLMNKINSEKSLVKEIKKRGKARNSDHYWFTEAGVPCFFIYTLGGTTSYHDIYDIAEKLPLTDYVDVFKLITEFADRL
jgi:aminopeptidase YwaD